MKGIKILQIALKMGSLLFGSLTVISVLSESSNQHIPEEPQVQVVSRKEAPAIVPLVINQTTEKVSSLSGTLYDVISVADGDTIKVWYNGSKQSVRILGIDTPEKFTTRTGQVECYGVEASKYANSLMAGKKVRLIIDPTQDTFDKYNRLLAHVFLEDGSYYQELAIKNGYGFRYVYKKPTVYDGRLLEAELLAKSNNVGVWDKCGGKRAAVQ